MDEILNKAALERLILLQRLGGKLGKIHDLHAVFPQRLRKAVVLRLCAVEVGNVVKKQTFQRIGHELLQLMAGPLQQYLFQRSNLTSYVNSHRLHPMFV